MPSAKTLESTILAVLIARTPKSACPSEIARKLAPNEWRSLMAPVRSAAARLAAQRRIDILQRGRVVRLADVTGPIRLALAYRIGRGEEGVLTLEPWKSELLPLWKFATPALARVSAAALWKRFMQYGRAGDFPGMDMARKFLQMGMTRATRYARHAGGRKYAAGSGEPLPESHDAVKAAAAAIFRASWERARKNPTYKRLQREWKAQHTS